MKDQVLGVLVEDHHISVGVVDLSARKVSRPTLQRKRIDPYASAEEIIGLWAQVISSVSHHNPEVLNRIGIGIPGACDHYEGTFLLNDKERYSSLCGLNIKNLLSERLAINPSNIRLMNDAACFLQGEAFAGSALGFDDSIGITLGKGLGSAIYKNGIAIDAVLHDMPLNGGGAEEYISTRWLLSRFTVLTGIPVQSLTEIVMLADENHNVQKVFSEFAINLAQFVIEFVKQARPKVVVIGGYIETCNRFFFSQMADYARSSGVKSPILRAMLGEQASILGAASTWHVSSRIHEREALV